MSNNRWNRSEEDVLRKTIEELENLLAQARKTRDVDVITDMFNRAGIKFSLVKGDLYTTVLYFEGCYESALLLFDRKGVLKA